MTDYDCFIDMPRALFSFSVSMWIHASFAIQHFIIRRREILSTTNLTLFNGVLRFLYGLLVPSASLTYVVNMFNKPSSRSGTNFCSHQACRVVISLAFEFVLFVAEHPMDLHVCSTTIFKSEVWWPKSSLTGALPIVRSHQPHMISAPFQTTICLLTRSAT
jgi:hypothetical protein